MVGTSRRSLDRDSKTRGTRFDQDDASLCHLSPRYLADEVKALDKYHGNDKPAGEPGTNTANTEGTPKDVDSPNAGQVAKVDSGVSLKSPRKAKPQTVKPGKTDSTMQGIGKK